MAYERQDELSTLLDNPGANIDRIESIVIEQCSNPYNRDLFSGFIGVFADAMIYLGSIGRLRIINDNGGRVVEAQLPTNKL
jgi:hypothetical protein